MIIYEGNAREKRPSIPNLAAEAAANNNTQQPPGWRRCQLFSSFFFFLLLFSSGFFFFFTIGFYLRSHSRTISWHTRTKRLLPPEIKKKKGRGRRWEKLFPCSGLTLKRQTLSIFLGLSFLFVFPSPFRLFPVNSGIDKWRHEIAIAQLSGLIHFRLWNNKKKKRQSRPRRITKELVDYENRISTYLFFFKLIFPFYFSFSSFAQVVLGFFFFTHVACAFYSSKNNSGWY